MKWLIRFISLVLCFTLMMNYALGENLEEEYTQSEKMIRQYELGSGLRGALKFAVSGESGVAALLSPLNETEFQVRSIFYGDDLCTQLYAVKNGSETAQTEIIKSGGSWYMKTSLLLGSTLSLTDTGDILSTITSSETNGNPSFYSFMMRFLTSDSNLWKDARIGSIVNSWLESYGQTPMVIKENGETHMKFQYIIPSNDLLNGMKVFSHSVLEDTALQKIIASLMTKEQAAVILNSDLAWYLDSVIDNIPLSGTAIFERTVTMQGTEVSSHITIPVHEPKGLWNTLDISSAGEKTIYTLSGTEINLVWEPETETTGSFCYQNGNNPSLSVAYEFSSKTETTVDSEDYHHETTTYMMKFSEKELEHASSEWIDFDPIEIQIRLHYYSKAAKRSATTLEITLAGIIPGGRIQAAAKFRTTIPWEVSKMNVEDSISIDGKTSEERLEIGEDILANLLMSLSKLESLETVDTEEPAASTDRDENASSETSMVTDSESEQLQDDSAAEELSENEKNPEVIMDTADESENKDPAETSEEESTVSEQSSEPTTMPMETED